MKFLADLARLAKKGQRAVRDVERVVSAVERGAVDARDLARGITQAADAIQGAAASTRSALGGLEARLVETVRPRENARIAVEPAPRPRASRRPAPAPAAPPAASASSRPRFDPSAPVVDAEIVDEPPRRP